MKAISRAVASLVLATALVASTASAAPREAQEQFEQGRALVKAGKPAEAIPKFLASIAAEPTLAALLNLADCYEKTGKLASARARFEQAQELARDKDPVRADEARKRAELLAPRVSMVTLIPPPKVEGVRVWVDGVEVPSSAWGVPRPFDAGPHEVVSQDARGKRKVGTVEVPVSAARLTFPIDAEPEPATAGPSGPVVAPPQSAAPPPDRGEPKTSDGGTLRTVGVVVGATGLVAIGVGAVTGVIALGASSDLKSACSTYPQCPTGQRGELTDLDDRARSFGTISTVTFISGAVLLAVGTVMFLAAPKSTTQGVRRVPSYAGVPLGAW